MPSEDQMAERLFGSPPPQAEGSTLMGGAELGAPESEKAEQRAEQASHTEEQAAQSLYGKEAEDETLAPVSAEVAELREMPERRMYSAQVTLREAIPDQEFANVEGIDEKAGNKAVRELRELAADLDFGPREIQTLRARAAFVSTSKPDVSMQREAAVDALNREFGQGAKQALRDARAMLQRDPRTAKVIEAMGLGDDPEVVLLVARAARSQRAAGKLKGK